jgi:hypothetical protein
VGVCGKGYTAVTYISTSSLWRRRDHSSSWMDNWHLQIFRQSVVKTHLDKGEARPEMSSCKCLMRIRRYTAVSYISASSLWRGLDHSSSCLDHWHPQMSRQLVVKANLDRAKTRPDICRWLDHGHPQMSRQTVVKANLDRAKTRDEQLNISDQIEQFYRNSSACAGDQTTGTAA